ncbi:MAG TPA: DUF116 domain-containing protein [Syntrophomonadaceae bacterium]|nr:DUF116 domain-containing protein [Syntrophomonadaceae bacterium]HOQ08865.1 DUF116 domain-containing protein [Syntrophomonadaceae bacterium]HPU47676.1 DUF116 domain-containing protein [Syntrophomonadaceae bacterium]
MEAKKRLYLGLLTFSLFLIAAVIWLAWYLIANRTMLVNQVLLVILVAGAILFLIIFALGIMAMVIMIIRSHTTPWQESVARVVNEWLFPVALLVGKLLRVDRDSILRSFISVNNYLVRSKKVKLPGEKVMILAPHCLQNSECPHKITIDVANCKQCGKCKIGELKQLAAQYDCKLRVVTGGTLARQAIKEQKPSAVVAIACERDLSLGIQDISVIPVLGIINCRPHGPCLNTDVDMGYVHNAMNFFSKGGR